MKETHGKQITGKILLVDDEEDVLHSVRDILLSEGFEVATAASGAKGMHLVEAENPDLILLDIHMPGMDGFEFCRRLRMQDAYREIPIIFLSGLTETADIVSAFSSGGSDYIVKPYKSRELISRVRSHLVRSRMFGEVKEKRDRLAQEIEDRKRVEEQLRESESRLRTVIESLPFDFFMIDNTGRYTMQNATCRRNWGDALGRKPEDVSPDRETTRIWLNNNRRAFNGETVREEVVLPSREGDRYIYNIITPIVDSQKIQGILGVNIDITELRWTEERLEQTKGAVSKMAKMAAECPNPILRVSPNGILLYANRASESIQKTWRCKIGQACSHPIAKQFQDIFDSGRIFEMTLVCDDGRRYSMVFVPDREENSLNVYGRQLEEIPH